MSDQELESLDSSSSDSESGSGEEGTEGEGEVVELKETAPRRVGEGDDSDMSMVSSPRLYISPPAAGGKRKYDPEMALALAQASHQTSQFLQESDEEQEEDIVSSRESGLRYL